MKPIEQLTDAELCREGAEAMLGRPIADRNTETLRGYSDDERRFGVGGHRLLTDPAHGLPMLMRINDFGLLWDVQRRIPDSPRLCVYISLPPLQAIVGYYRDSDPLRAILKALVAAYRHSQEEGR